MNWTELLKDEIESVYAVTDGLLDLTSDDELDWKPSTGSNWMTVGQLLMHITNSCGACMKGFVTGDWCMPEGMDLSDMKPEDMLPSAEKMPSVKSVQEARDLLAVDKQVALNMVEKAGEERLENEAVSAPWDSGDVKLGCRLLSMTGHLTSHKSQLFYYLKLQGKSVNTHNLWGKM